LCEDNKNKYDTYFKLFKKDAKVGMLCSISNNTIVDCWGQKYDLSDVNRVEFGKVRFDI
jgi:hypothetical protein